MIVNAPKVIKFLVRYKTNWEWTAIPGFVIWRN
jgi:hypothetical protein